MGIEIKCDKCNKKAELLYAEDGNPVNYGNIEIGICGTCKDLMYDELDKGEKAIKDKYYKKKK